jgi:hypothetical protein
MLICHHTTLPVPDPVPNEIGAWKQNYRKENPIKHLRRVRDLGHVRIPRWLLVRC